MMPAEIAQIPLRFGADAIDGTVVEEKIYHDAGATTPQGLRRHDLVRLIEEAGREPIERDTLYLPVTRTETSFTVSVWGPSSLPHSAQSTHTTPRIPLLSSLSYVSSLSLTGTRNFDPC